MSEQPQVSVMRFVPPDDVPAESEVIEDASTVAIWKTHFSAIQWAVTNPGGFYLFVAFLPALQMPAQRPQLYQMAADTLTHLREELEENGPSDTRTVLVRQQLSEAETKSALGLVPSS